MIQFGQKIGLEIPPTRNYQGLFSVGISSYRWFKYHISEGSSNASVGYVLFESFALNSALLICLRLEMCWLIFDENHLDLLKLGTMEVDMWVPRMFVQLWFDLQPQPQ